MSDDLIKELQSALDNLDVSELLCPDRTSFDRASEALRFGQRLVYVSNPGSEPLVAVTGLCAFCSDSWTTDAYESKLLFRGLQLWVAGAHIQDVLGFMSASEREFLISGVAPMGWDALHGSDHLFEEPGDREPFFPKDND